MINAYEGNLPADPFLGLVECYAGSFEAVAIEAQTMSTDAQFQLGKEFGRPFGEVASQLSYLYRRRAMTTEELTEIASSALEIHGLIEGPRGPAREATVRALASTCALSAPPRSQRCGDPMRRNVGSADTRTASLRSS